jgi:predicted alpha-1,2-mannosidase
MSLLKTVTRIKNTFPSAQFPLFVSLLMTVVFSSLSAQAKNNTDPVALTQYVDPMIGTGGDTDKGNATDDLLQGNSGQTVPGPKVPFGMIYWGPNTLADNDEKITDKYAHDVGYQYNHERIEGFGLTHLSGPGCTNTSEMPIIPFSGSTDTSQVKRLSHQEEQAQAGYYRLSLDNGTQVELTSKTRLGYGRFLFKNLKKGQIYGLNFLTAKRASEPDADETGVQKPIFHFADPNLFTGSVQAGNFCDSPNMYRLYFAGELNQGAGTTEVNSKLARANYVATQDGDAVLELKIAISYVSEENALLNLAAERVNDQGQAETFETTRRSATQAWDKVLNSVRIQSSPLSPNSLRDHRNFYTALYHSFLHPNIAEDVNGQYRGYDDKIYSVNVNQGHHHYVNFSGWDIYRSELQLLSILFPSKASDMAQSLVDAAKQCGGIPQWAVNNSDTAVMGGDAGPTMLSDFNAFGADQFDRSTAFHYMIQHGTNPNSQCNGHPSRPEMAQYLAKGYLVQNDITYTTDVGFVSMTLEYAASDFAISRFAHALSTDQNDRYARAANHFLKQSGSWKNLWFISKKYPGYLRGRRANGEWITPFFTDENPVMKDPKNPTQDFSQGFVEGSSAQYSLMIPFDYADVLKGMGSKAQVDARLQKYFSKVNGGLIAPYMHIGNEPSFSDPWIWLWMGEPANTQEVVHRTIQQSYFDVPGGLPGNDDLGATSSWYVFATLGLYPVIPGEGGLAIHGPYFAQVDLNLENGKSIHIRRSGDGIYIQDLAVNANAYASTWINWSDLKNGADLNFTMGTQPSAWGSAPADIPPSFSAP